VSLTYGSVCSGIEAASVAWRPLGWRAAFLSEIEPFPRAVLKHHWAEAPLHGDFTTIKAGEYAPIDLLVGGTPCQSFSVAGLRGGLDDDRGNLALEYLRLADRLRPRWLVWENVPGVLSSGGGRDFGSILGGMGELGYGWAYRVLDAQFFGVAQRRRRVFVVGYLGDWRRAAAVLFERHCLSGHPAPRRQAGQRITRPIAAGSPDGSGYRNDADTADNLIAGTLQASGKAAGSATQQDAETGLLVANPLRAQAQSSHRPDSDTFVAAYGGNNQADGVGALRAASGGSSRDYVAFGGQMSTPHWQYNISDTLQAKNPKAIAGSSAVRRLTPRECERLQGFPDDYTLIPWRKGMAPDGPRYRALGNSMAVPCMAWLGHRIAAVEAIIPERSAA
jgi:DNA (cytosine-5)-methyltransferase 1